MQVKAISKYIKVSPYKLRPYANAVRGRRVDKAVHWLEACSVAKTVPLIKTINSAFSNAKNVLASDTATQAEFFIKEIRVDGGPITKYYKPGAMGRSSVQRRRTSHVEVVVEKKPVSLEK